MRSYRIKDSKSSHRCPYKKRQRDKEETHPGNNAMWIKRWRLESWATSQGTPKTASNQQKLGKGKN